MRTNNFIPALDLLTFFSGAVFNLSILWLISNNSSSDLVLFGMLQSLFLIISTALTSPIIHKFNKLKLLFISILLLILKYSLLLTTLKEYNLFFFISLSLLSCISMSVYHQISNTIIADIVSTNKLDEAIQSQTRYREVGLILAPILTASLSIYDNFLFYCYTMSLISTLLSMLLLIYSRKEHPNLKNKITNNENYLLSVKKGVSSFFKVKSEFHWAMRNMVMAACIIPLTTTFLPLYIKNTGADYSSYSLLEFVFSVAAILATFSYKKINSTINNKYISMLSMSICSVSLIYFSLASNIFLCSFLFLLIGYFFTINNLNERPRRLIATPSIMRPRFKAINYILMKAALSIGVSFGGIIINYSSVVEAYQILSIILFIAAISSPLIHKYNHLMSSNITDCENYYKIQYPNVFSEKQK